MVADSQHQSHSLPASRTVGEERIAWSRRWQPFTPTDPNRSVLWVAVVLSLTGVFAVSTTATPDRVVPPGSSETSSFDSSSSDPMRSDSMPSGSAPTDPAGGESNRANRNTTGFVLDVNTAPVAEWIVLPGIGPSLAERIVAERTARGGFSTLDDVASVRGIGPKTFAKIHPYLVVARE